MYTGICESLLSIRVLVSGAKLADCIEQLIELNQQITLEITGSEGSESAIASEASGTFMKLLNGP